MNKNLSLIFLVLIIFSGCSKIEIFEKTDATEESEPNDESYRADEITECINYTGRIAKPDKNRSDKDLFKIWKPAGTLITFEFETDAEGFMPYIAILIILPMHSLLSLTVLQNSVLSSSPQLTDGSILR